MSDLDIIDMHCHLQRDAQHGQELRDYFLTPHLVKPGAPNLGTLSEFQELMAVTGISGAIMARPLLNLLGMQDPAVRGFAVGITAHAIGTARAMQVGTVNGAFAALALGLNGVATAILMPLLLKVLRPLL